MMFNRSFITGLGILGLYTLLLVIDAFLNVHVFSIGFLLSLLFFVPNYQVFTLFLVFGFLHDVRFQFPLGTSFILLAPYLFLFSILLAFIRSRMLVLYGYLVVVGCLFSYLEYKESWQPLHVIFTLLFSLIWAICVYFYAIHRYQDYSFNTKKKNIRF